MLFTFLFVIVMGGDCNQEHLPHFVSQYNQKAPVSVAFEAGLDEARLLRFCFVDALKKEHGGIVGYKAALTNPPSQKKFGVSEPLLGMLLKGMIYPSGSTLPLKYGARPLFEGDLILRVGSDKINQANTPAEFMAHIDAVIPFLELPDLVYQPGLPLNGASITAINAGARAGIVGEAILIQDHDFWQKALGQIKVTLYDENDQVLGEGHSAGLLGHPLNVVHWLRDALKKEGLSLKAGDLLSLGSITPLVPAKEKGTIRAKYEGLGQDIELSVTFQ